MTISVTAGMGVSCDLSILQDWILGYIDAHGHLEGHLYDTTSTNLLQDIDVAVS